MCSVFCQRSSIIPVTELIAYLAEHALQIAADRSTGVFRWGSKSTINQSTINYKHVFIIHTNLLRTPGKSIRVVVVVSTIIPRHRKKYLLRTRYIHNIIYTRVLYIWCAVDGSLLRSHYWSEKAMVAAEPPITTTIACWNPSQYQSKMDEPPPPPRAVVVSMGTLSMALA